MTRAVLLLLALVAVAGDAAADPEVSRVLTAPTAWLPPAGAITGTAGLDHELQGHAHVGYSLGGLAAIEVGGDTDVRSCGGSCDDPSPRWLARASFRLGARQDAWFRGMPALVLGVRNTIPVDDARVTDAYVVASREVTAEGHVFRFHAGASATAAVVNDLELRPTVRPLGGFEWTTPQYPRSTLLVDIAWLARLDARGPDVEWVAGWGVRYQAFRWGAIELAVRHRQSPQGGPESVSQSKVMVRVSGVWDAAAARRK